MIKSELGQFYVGDPCYVLSDENYHNVWGDKYNFSDGQIQIFAERGFIVHGTAYGDGSYEDQYGNIYGVDSGTLAVIPLELVAKNDGLQNGKVFDGKMADLNYYDDGVFTIQVGNKNIIINTGDEEVEEEENDEWYDYSDEEEYLESKHKNNHKKVCESTEEYSFDEIITRMSDAEDYDDLYAAANLIADTGIQAQVEELISTCETDGDDVETAYSIVTSDILDGYVNEENVENLTESVNCVNEDCIQFPTEEEKDEYIEENELEDEDYIDKGRFMIYEFEKEPLEESSSPVINKLVNALKDRYTEDVDLDQFAEDIGIVMWNTRNIYDAVKNTRQRAHTAPYMALIQFCNEVGEDEFTSAQVKSALKELGIDYKDLLASLVKEVEEYRINELDESKDLKVESFEKEEVYNQITEEEIKNFNLLKDILSVREDLELVDGYYFPAKAVDIIRNTNTEYHLNGYMDLSISDILLMVEDNDTIKEAIDQLYEDYKPESAYTWSMNFLDVLSKLNLDVEETEDIDYEDEEYLDESKEDQKMLSGDETYVAKNQFNYSILGLIIDNEGKRFQLVDGQAMPLNKHKKLSKKAIRQKADELLKNGYTEYKGYASVKLNENKELKTEIYTDEDIKFLVSRGDLEKDLTQYFEENNLFVDDIYIQDNGKRISITVDGDWKHDHLRCRNLMEKLGYYFIGDTNIEEDGGDWYKAIKVFDRKEGSNLNESNSSDVSYNDLVRAGEELWRDGAVVYDTKVDGIYDCHTDGHGGYLVDTTKFPKLAKYGEPTSIDNIVGFEEDYEALKVIWAVPEVLTDAQLNNEFIKNLTLDKVLAYASPLNDDFRKDFPDKKVVKKETKLQEKTFNIFKRQYTGPLDEDEDLFDVLLNIRDAEAPVEEIEKALQEIAPASEPYITPEWVYDEVRVENEPLSQEQLEMFEDEGIIVDEDVADSNIKYVFDPDKVYHKKITINGQEFDLQFKITDYYNCILTVYDIVEE